jgi:tellurite resistance protein TehA-like permease
MQASAVTPPPDVFAVVMATGILSIAAGQHYYRWMSEILGVVAAITLLVLVVLVVGIVLASRLAKRRIALWDLRDPDVTLRLFTFVAACAVLDSRVASDPVVAHVLGVVALSAWLVLILLSTRNMVSSTWTALRDRAHGVWELASVGSSGLAIVTTQAARYTGQHWWLTLGVPAWIAAMGSYALMTSLIVWRAIAERGDRDGFEPDTWILMGALAIATLAADDIHQLAPGWLAADVRTITVVTWAVATLWIPPLIYFGLHHIGHRPEVLQFTGVWWALVFPLGMYSAATDTMASEMGHRWMQTVSLVFFWDAFAVWVIVVVAGLLRVRHRVAC